MFCPHSVFMCFVWIWEQTAIISLYSINWLVLYSRRGVFTARYGLDIYIKIRPLVTICTTSLTFTNSTFCPHSIYVFCVDLRTNSDYFPIQHQMTGFYIRDGVCLLRGTDWVFIYKSDQWLLHVPPGLTFTNSTFCPYSIYVFCVDQRKNNDYFPIQH